MQTHHLVAWLLLLLHVSNGEHNGSLPQLNIDMESITVSGVSSGAAMAIQFHVAFSSALRGVGVIAGPPYWCAQDILATALTACTKDPALISVTELVAATEYAATLDSIDKPSHLAKSRAWFFSGTNDTVVHSGVVLKSQEYYGHWIPESASSFVNNIPAEHSWVTDSYGNPCDVLAAPFVSNCGFDTAGSMLQFLLSNSTLQPRTTQHLNNLYLFGQRPYTPLEVAPADLSMGESGYVYIPQACLAGATQCRLHIVFHGCEQFLSSVGTALVEHAGLNEWAESNNIVVLYPQTTKSDVVPFNPKGCWDWWGYTGTAYATVIGPQMATVKNMVCALTGSFASHRASPTAAGQ